MKISINQTMQYILIRNTSERRSKQKSRTAHAHDGSRSASDVYKENILYRGQVVLAWRLRYQLCSGTVQFQLSFIISPQQPVCGKTIPVSIVPIRDSLNSLVSQVHLLSIQSILLGCTLYIFLYPQKAGFMCGERSTSDFQL